MFERWRKENFFKYLREEYALDALVDYGVQAADASRDVPNPKHKEIKAQLRKAHAELDALVKQYGVEAIVNVESMRRTIRGFKIANADISKRIFDALKHLTGLEKRKANIPTRVPDNQVTKGEVVKLAVERKHITDLFKMVAYQAEGDLLRMVTPNYRRAEDEGRTLSQNALGVHGDIEMSNSGELHIILAPLSSPHKTKVLRALCVQLTGTKTKYPGTSLRLVFAVKTEPKASLAFPGFKHKTCSNQHQPDISARG
jgi:hypothetical protein